MTDLDKALTLIDAHGKVVAAYFAYQTELNKARRMLAEAELTDDEAKETMKKDLERAELAWRLMGD